MPEAIDYEAVLADLEAQKTALEAAIAGIRQMLGRGPQTVPSAPTGRPESTVIESDTFFALTVGEAAKKYLRMTKRKQSAAAIAEALDEGGLHHTSKSFPNTVRTALIRDPEVVQVGRGEWGLAEWYPGRRRKERGVSLNPRDFVPDESSEEAK